MTLKLYDTYARSLREFEPIESGKAGLYCCGPTVYNFAHIGNLRTYVFEDVLRRVLEVNGFEVKHVVNITDVGHLVSDADEGEDKMAAGARRTGKSAWEIATVYTDAFLDDLNRLNILTPTVLCKATDHIDEQIEAIGLIESKGLTYKTDDGLYFDTAQVTDYGYLARLKRDGLQAGARVEQGQKRNNTDFALWKFSPEDEQRQMEWDSPWGKGFPGWHIECSAMAAKYLGPLFDIHCGGKDHIPIHHSNEIAQSQACYGTRLSNYWMHGYFLHTNKLKMSKSSGEFLRMASLIERGYDPHAFRFLCLLAHYRSDINFSWAGLDSATTALGRLRETYQRWELGGKVNADFYQRFLSFVNDDLNTSQAIALTWELVKSDIPEADRRATLDEFNKVFGLDLSRTQSTKAEDVSAEVLDLAAQRQQSRLNKDWAAADVARDKLESLGYEVLDTAQGFELKKIRTDTDS